MKDLGWVERVIFVPGGNVDFLYKDAHMILSGIITSNSRATTQFHLLSSSIERILT